MAHNPLPSSRRKETNRSNVFSLGTFLSPLLSCKNIGVWPFIIRWDNLDLSTKCSYMLSLCFFVPALQTESTSYQWPVWISHDCFTDSAIIVHCNLWLLKRHVVLMTARLIWINNIFACVCCTRTTTIKKTNNNFILIRFRGLDCTSWCHFTMAKRENKHKRRDGISFWRTGEVIFVSFSSSVTHYILSINFRQWNLCLSVVIMITQ